MTVPKPKADKSRAFTFTIFHFDENTENFLQELECRYIVYGYEICPTTSRPHFQGYVYFDNARTFKAITKLIPGHIEIAKGAPEQNYDYCSKDGHFFERGQRPISDKAKGANEKARFDAARASALRGDWQSIPSDIYIRYQASLKRINKEDRPPATDLQGEGQLLVGLWIWGPTRTGKSRRARELYPNLYDKGLNKWWDGYDGTSPCHLEDFAPEHAQYLTGFLKRWADRYAFRGETKNGGGVFRPSRVVITSNYEMDQCFNGADLAALKARFEIIHMP